MKDSIVFCGNIIVDQIKMITRWPDKGMLVPVTSVKRAVGGSVSNTSVDLKALDPSVNVKALGVVGTDESGDYAVRFLESKGIDCTEVSKTSERPTSFTDVMTVEGTGERTFFNMHGADSLLTPDDVDVDRLDCDIFHFGYLLLLDGMDAPDDEYGTKAARLLAKVQAAGIKTSVDIVSEHSDRFARIVRPALKYCDYCIINEIEGSMATGRKPDDLKGICEGLFELGVKERAVIHCPDVGASMGKSGDFTSIGSLQLPDGWPRGAGGAGAASCPGSLSAPLEGFYPEKLLRLGSCAAAMNLAVPDAVSGARSFEETMTLDARFERR